MVAVSLGVTATLLATAVPHLGSSMTSSVPGLRPAGYSAGTTTAGTMCSGYAGCASRGRSNAGYASHNSRMYWQMYSGHNCTNYVAYRMVRKGLPNRRPWSSSGSGNATNWGNYLRGKTNGTPTVGAVAWWRAGNNHGSAGHVAYVEKVISRDAIVVSQDSWGGDFSWATITRSSGWPSGFIHLKDTPLKNRERPQVSGSRRVGQTVSATRGKWKPRPSVSYSWTVGGKRVGGANGRTLRLTRQMIGKKVRVRTAATRFGYPRTTARSAATRTVLPGRFDARRSPDLSGAARVHQTLRISSGSWSPTPRRVGYRWFADGKKIAGADSSRLRLTPAMAHDRVSAEVTVKRPGYETRTRTVRAGHDVRPARLKLGRAARLAGSPRTGKALRLSLGETKPAAKRTIRWLRDGKVVDGADARRYRLTRADLGHRISARVTYRKLGYRTVQSITERTALVKTTPRVRTSADRVRRSVLLTVVARAGGDGLRSTVVVQRGGKLLAKKAMRDGKVTLRLRRGLPRGRSKVRVIVLRTDVSERAELVRKVRR